MVAEGPACVAADSRTPSSRVSGGRGLALVCRGEKRASCCLSVRCWDARRWRPPIPLPSRELTWETSGVSVGACCECVLPPVFTLESKLLFSKIG